MTQVSPMVACTRLDLLRLAMQRTLRSWSEASPVTSKFARAYSWYPVSTYRRLSKNVPNGVQSYTALVTVG